MSESNCIYYTEKFPNAQFTELEFKQARSTDKLKFICAHCGEIFLRRKYDAIHKKPVHCSMACKKASQEANKITGKCLLCGKPVTKRRREYERHPTFFCSLSCRATYTNRNRDSSIYDKARVKISNSIKALREAQKEDPSVCPKTSKKAINRAYQRNKKLRHTNYKCKICGALGHTCRYPEICKSHIWYTGDTLSCMGLNLSALGTEKIYDEYFRLKFDILQKSRCLW